ncbi:MAG: hypothetical protein U9R53_11835 [Chloroflexota bacterium]|nr:hypothetical protein [Chloroflexota bacterium]
MIMKRNVVLFLAAVIIFLLVGWILYKTFNQGGFINPGDTGFRSWFWEKRGLDLVVQIILVFAGALGIAAILPIEGDDD